MRAYKGFDKDLKCRGFQYEVGKTYEMDESKVEICSSGFHACENPFDVLNHYGIGDGNRFCEVEQDGKIEKDKDGRKQCSSRIEIRAEIGIKGLVSAFISFVKESVKNCKAKQDKDYARIGSSGDSAQIGSSGYSARIDSSGEDSVICCAGVNSTARAKKGSWITLSEWKYDNTKERYVPVCVKTEQVDGERIKADTWYKLENGEFVEVKDDRDDD